MEHILLNQNFGKIDTVIVLGAGRGGTSLVAGCLRSLDVCMGEDPHPLKHEWSPIVRAADDSVYMAATREQIESMNRQHKIWGWKSPKDAFVLESIFPCLRNPGLIIVTRAPSEVAYSAHKHQEIPFEIAFYDTSTVYQMIADRMRYWPWPILCVAFREILDHAEDFVDVLCSFLKLDPNPEDKRRAISFVDPEAKTYQLLKPDPLGPSRISQDDLEADIIRAAEHYVEQYSSQYLHDFAAILDDARGAAKILKGLVLPEKLPVLLQLAENICTLFGNFSANHLRDLGLCAFSNQTSIPAATTESECLQLIDGVIDELAAAIQEAERKGSKIHDLNKDRPYAGLTRIHQLLQILIRVRVELQRALQSPPRTAQTDL
ncbi:MAG: hypothetical protein ACXV8U_15020 [Methylobacter sp.]